MAVHSFPFDLNPDGSKQETSEGHFRHLLRAAVPSGVVPGVGDDLVVTGTDDGALQVGTGFAVLEGYGVEVDEPERLEVPLNTSNGWRRDRAVLRLDRQARTILPTVVTGTPSPSPQLPALTRNETVWDLPLAAWHRRPNGGGIAFLARTREYSTRSGAAVATSGVPQTSLGWGGLVWETDTQRLRVAEAVTDDGPQWRTLVEASYPTPWRSINLRSGYRSPGHGHSPQWRWYSKDTVQLRGTIERSSGAQIPRATWIGTMPSECVPHAQTYQALASHQHGDGHSVRGYITSPYSNTWPQGRIVIYYPSRRRGPNWVSLDGWFYTL